MSEEPESVEPRGAPGTAGSAARPLSPEARRALAEAEERRRLAAKQELAGRVSEIGGRDGPEPVRYGDWERNGIISDF